MPDSKRLTEYENRERLIQKRCRLNLYRAGMSSAAVCIAMLVVVASFLLLYRLQIFGRPYRMYMLLAFLTISFSAAALPVCWRFLHRAEAPVPLVSRLEMVYAAFFLLIGIALALLPEMGVSPIVPLIAVTVLTGSVPILEPRRLAGLFTGACAVYLMGMILTRGVDGGEVLLLGIAAAFSVLSAFIGNARYTHFVREFYNQAIIEEKNRSLRELNEQLKLASLTDPLTGISNRRGLDEFTGNEWGKLRSEHRVVSMLMIDIDFFKQYNDMFGHIEGDRCLVQITRRIRELLRRWGGKLYRFGGEEFVVIFPDMTQEKAAAAAEEIRGAVEGLHLRNPYNGRDCDVTTSIGLAAAGEQDDTDFMDMLDQADKALYRAKRQGRNRVVSYAGAVSG